MHQNKAASAIGLPLWMVLLAVVLFVARIVFTVSDKTQTMQSPLNWLTPKQLSEKVLKPDQLLLYDFSAVWCGPCQLMDKTTFRDKNVIAELNRHFVLVRIMDPDGTTMSAPEKLEAKRLQQKFDVTGFPQFDTALPNGVSISSKMGYCSPRALLSFLILAEKKGGFFAGRSLIIDHPLEAAKELEQWLNDSADWSDTKYGLAAAYAAVCYRRVHDEASAKRVLELAQREVAKELWPRSLIDYLHGDCKFGAVLDEATGDDINVTDAKGVAAMNMRALGNIKDSDELLEWMRDNGSHTCFTYDWALSLLNSHKRQEHHSPGRNVTAIFRWQAEPDKAKISWWKKWFSLS